MKITIFGTWYVGLVTWTCLAEVWHEVMCIDLDADKIQALKNWIIPIYEPWLEELVVRNYKLWRLSFSTDAEAWVDYATVIFSAVGTPPDKNHRADLKYVKAVAKTVWKHMNEYKVFINKSTVPVGTGKVCRDIISSETEHPFDIVSNPEFLREGTAVKDFMVPERIVCWVENDKVKSIMSEVYAPFEREYIKMIWTDIPSAEIAKYAANAFLATKLSFINEIANFAELSWGNITDITKCLWSDSRVWNKFLHAGSWYGGSCFPKDVDALIETGKDYWYDFQIIRATESVNKAQQLKPLEKLLEYIPDIRWKTISVWGLSFKPKTDDIRDAPSLMVIQKLLERWVKTIKCYDPVAMENTQRYFNDAKNIVYCSSNLEAAQESHALLVMTEWDEFRAVNKKSLLENMKGNVIIDGRNIWRKSQFSENVKYEWIWK